MIVFSLDSIDPFTENLSARYPRVYVEKMNSLEYLNLRSAAKNEVERETLFKRATESENEDRACYSRTRDGWEVLGREDLSTHPHPSLIPMFDSSTGVVRESEFRIDEMSLDDTNPERRVLPLDPKQRRLLTGTCSLIKNIDEFRTNFFDVFCEGQLRYINWNNVFAAGGGVLACATPVPSEYSSSVTLKRKYFHDIQYAASDVDLFLHGLTEDQAKEKLVEIYTAVCEACPFPVVCFRSAHAVTLVSQYPFRHVQIVLRIYSSPYEILAGFDVDACTVGFDGNQVYADIRAHHALVTRRNTIDLTRRSPSYEMRLAKYGVRGFEVEVPSLKRGLIDPGIFERPWKSLEGLAKLMVLERLRTPEQRAAHFERNKMARSAGVKIPGIRGRINDNNTQQRIEEKLGGSAEVSNYSTVFLPWGPNITAEQVIRLMETKDIMLNNKWFSKNRQYRLHPCFYGTASEILGDCSPSDPPFPPKPEHREESDEMKEHRETFVRGPLAFITDDPGRQRIGSFHPLDEHGWTDSVYFVDTTEQIFEATNRNDVAKINDIFSNTVEARPLDQRDFFGRTVLQFAMIAGSIDVAKALLEMGANPMESMAGRRSCFHLCAIYNHWELVPLLVKAGLARITAQHLKDSGASETDEKMKKKIRGAVVDWIRAFESDRNMSAVDIALFLGNFNVVDALMGHGASLTSYDMVGSPRISPLQLITQANVHEGIATLLRHGFKTSSIELSPRQNMNGLHLAFQNENLSVHAVELLKQDPSCVEAFDLYQQGLYPLAMAASQLNVEAIELMLQKGCPLVPKEESLGKSIKLKTAWSASTYNPSPFQPLECAVSAWLDEFYNLIKSFNKVIQARTSRSQAMKVKSMTSKVLLKIIESNYELAEDLSSAEQSVAEFPKISLRKSLKAIQLLVQHPGIDLLVLQPKGRYSRYTRFSQHLSNTQVTYLEFFSMVIDKLQWQVTNLLNDTMKESTARLREQHNMTTQVITDLMVHVGERSTYLKYTLNSWLTSHNIEARDALDKALSMEALSIEERQEIDRYIWDLNDVVTAFRGVFSHTPAGPLPMVNPAFADSPTTVATSKLQKSGSKIGQSNDSTLVYTRVASSYPDYDVLFVSDMDLTDEFPSQSDIALHMKSSSSAFPTPESVTIKSSSLAWFIEPGIDSWAKVAMERLLLKKVARGFTLRGKSGYFLPLRAQMYCVELFQCAYEGRVAELKDICDRGDIPILVCDANRMTLLHLAVLKGDDKLFREVTRIAKLQYVPEDKGLKQKKKKRSHRIDNMALMNAQFQEDYEEVDDAEGEEDEELGDDNLACDEANDEDKKKSMGGEKSKQVSMKGQCHLKCDDILKDIGVMEISTNCVLYQRLLSQIEEGRKRLGDDVRWSKDGMSPLVEATALQFAILLNQPSMVECIIDEAYKCDAELPRDLLISCTLSSRMRSEGSFSWKPLAMCLNLNNLELFRLILNKVPDGLDYEEMLRCLGVAVDAYSDVFPPNVSSSNKHAKHGRSTQSSSIWNGYSGIMTELYGAKLREAQTEKKAGSARFAEFVPLPSETFLMNCAKTGAVNSYQFLKNGKKGSKLYELVESLIKNPKLSKFRELLARARDRCPRAFHHLFHVSPMRHNITNKDDRDEMDTITVMYYFFGGSDAIHDSKENWSPLHYMIASRRLNQFLSTSDNPNEEIFSKELLSRSYEDVLIEDKVRFHPLKGQSPLSLACSRGFTKECEILITTLNFNPNSKDSYCDDQTPFLVCVSESNYETARKIADFCAVASMIATTKEHGLTALMISNSIPLLIKKLEDANSSSTKEALELLRRNVNQVDLDGETLLHQLVGSLNTDIETLELVVKYMLELDYGKLIPIEEYLYGRAPLDVALNTSLGSALGVPTRNMAAGRSRLLSLMRQLFGHDESSATAPRIRAKFENVLRARNRALDASGSQDKKYASDEEAKVESMRKNYIAAWVSSSSYSPYSYQSLNSRENEQSMIGIFLARLRHLQGLPDDLCSMKGHGKVTNKQHFNPASSGLVGSASKVKPINSDFKQQLKPFNDATVDPPPVVQVQSVSSVDATQGQNPVKVDDALTYLDEVKHQFSDQPHMLVFITINNLSV